jgi:hypothetical protein
MAVAVALSSGTAQAGAPFTCLDGVGGIAFNPLAYLAGTPTEGCAIAKPIMGMWYIDLGNSKIDWTCAGVATSIAKRVEVSYGFETVDIDKVLDVHKDTLGAKVLLVEENAGGTQWVPAVSAGVKHKLTSYHVGAGQSNDGNDLYLVASKLIPQAGVPVLVSLGAQSTREQVTGVIGFNSQRATIGFANLDFIPASWLCLGAEYRMGPSYGAAGGNYKDADYFNLHAAYFATRQFSFAAAYTNAGKNTFNGEPGPRLGFGGGLVVSMQYAF